MTNTNREISKMSALKSAVELMVAFKEEYADEEKTSEDIALGLAEKFYAWISRHEPEEAETISFHEQVKKDIHRIQEAIGLTLTDFARDACPFGSWDNGGAELLLESLKSKKNGGKSKTGSKSKTSKQDTRYKENPNMWLNESKTQLSSKQYGYIIRLFKDLKEEPDYEEINGLTSSRASELIEDLKARIEVETK